MENKEMVEKLKDWFSARAERAMELDTPTFMNRWVAFVGTSLEDEAHYYKVSVKPGQMSCGCKDWKYRGQKHGVPCKHMIRVMAERMLRDQEKAQEAELAENLKEADEAVARGELVC